ncbi:MAG TPA: TatD family hydrolase [Candidatus Didemnitutus sp.]|nr:TatD family hydrolase [Candidatus Didemnitutus sp.]
MVPLYDAHNHFQDDWLTPHRATVDAELRRMGLRRAVVNGTSETDWPAVVDLARQYNWVVPTFGLHPWDVGNRTSAWQATLEAALAGNAEAKIGEIGLDRWILDRAKPDDPRLAGLRRAPLEEQIEVFTWQLELAARRNRASSIHCLDAFGATLDVLTRTPRPACGFLLHAYSGPAEMVKKFADLGAYFSFNGSFLDPRHAAKQDVFKTIPADRVLVETDAPAMRLPSAHEKFPPLATPDGTVANHPANIAAVYAGLAELRGVPLAKLADQVEANFVRLFG